MSTVTRPWDDGVRWHLEQSAADAPDLADDTLDLDFILSHHLKSAHPAAETTYVDHLRKVSLREAERQTGRSLLPQWWTMMLDQFPWGDIVLPRPPLLEVESITYLDSAEVETVLSPASPQSFLVDAPSGERAEKGRVMPMRGAAWPSVSPGSGAVAVRFRAGYLGGIPDEIQHGRLVAIAEMTKQRSESVHISQSAAMRTARRFFYGYKVYGH